MIRNILLTTNTARRARPYEHFESAARVAADFIANGPRGTVVTIRERGKWQAFTIREAGKAANIDGRYDHVTMTVFRDELAEVDIELVA